MADDGVGASGRAALILPGGVLGRIRLVGWLVVLAVLLALLVIDVVRRPHAAQLVYVLFAGGLLVVTRFVLSYNTAVRIEPGVAVTRIGPATIERRPLVGPTAIVHYANVRKPGRTASPSVPPGPVDRRWAVVVVDGRVLARLSTYNWTPDQLVDLAERMRSTLRIVEEVVTPDAVEAAVPGYYTWWERHLGAYWTMFWLASLGIPALGMAALVASQL